MNTLRNRVQLLGRVGRNPEVVTLEDGKKLAKFSLATPEQYRDKHGDKISVTNWHHVSFWNGSATLIEKYVFQGSEIAVEGKLTSRSWEDMSGTRHYSTQVIGTTLVLLGKKDTEQVENSGYAFE